MRDNTAQLSADDVDMRQAEHMTACAELHMLLAVQDKPPSACSQLLTTAAVRQLNIESLNRLAVNTFVDKQADATPQDMAGLMHALALVRCCSSNNSNQVCEWAAVVLLLPLYDVFG